MFIILRNIFYFSLVENFGLQRKCFTDGDGRMSSMQRDVLASCKEPKQITDEHRRAVGWTFTTDPRDQ